MNAIRPLTGADVPGLALLYEQVMRSQRSQPPPLLAPALERMFLGQPWRDPEIPSLVCCDGDGRVVGFIGSLVRRLKWQGKPLRLAACGPLIAAPEARSRGVGALLLQRFLAGPQDITTTDGGTDVVAQLWTRLGGVNLGLYALNWVEFLSPVAFAVSYGLEHRQRLSWLRPIARPVCAPLDALVARLRRPPARTVAVVSEPLEPATVAAHIEQLAAGRLYPAYDVDHVGWLFREMSQLTSRGTFCRHLVRDAVGQVLGWHVSFVKPGGFADVVQLVAAPGVYEQVLGDLFEQIQALGAAAVRGRLEPHLVAPLTARRTWSCRGLPGLFHARDRSLLAALALGEALITRMDGEWWMALHLERYGGAS